MASAASDLKEARPLPSPAQNLSTTTERTSESAASAASSQAQNVPPTSSWFGTWSRKSGAVTEVSTEDSAKPTISSTVETGKSDPEKPIDKDKFDTASINTTRTRADRKSSLALIGKAGTVKTGSLDAATTRDHAREVRPSQGNSSDALRRHSTRHRNKTKADLPDVATAFSREASKTKAPRDQYLADIAKLPENETSQIDDGALGAGSSGASKKEASSLWTGWLTNGQVPLGHPASLPEATYVKDVAKPSNDDSAISKLKDAPSSSTTFDSAVKSDNSSVDSAVLKQYRRSWLPWTSAEATQSEPNINTPSVSPQPTEAESSTQENVPVEGALSTRSPTQPEHARKTGVNDTTSKQDTTSGWSFWSRTATLAPTVPNIHPDNGENSVSKVDIVAKSMDEQNKKGHGKQISTTSVNSTKILQNSAPQDIVLKDPDANSSEVKSKPTKSIPEVTKVQGQDAKAAAVPPAKVETPRNTSPAPPKKNWSHQLVPSLHDTLSLQEEKSLAQRLAGYVYTDEMKNHLYRLKEPSRVKRALCIGVHGYFPAPLLQKVLGPPTGTSAKFADMAAHAVRRWSDAHKQKVEVKSAALEGEGKIDERLVLLWNLLLGWIEDVRKSDLVIFACHSQGVPVATMLLAKLISFGCLGHARVALLAMAGVNLGPFSEYKSRWIGGSAAELFEFSNPDSTVSKAYVEALQQVLKSGAKLTCVGSIDDQLVSLESSLFVPVSHPHIYRAVSINTKVHAPSFLSHLIAFALKLRDLGVQDHGLIREISLPLAGSLYTGDGHSRLYEDEEVYDLAIAFALETTDMKGVDLTYRKQSPTSANPYLLPFAVRGLLEEDISKHELKEEVTSLIKEFDEWKPITKPLQDVKFRLEGIRSQVI